MERVSGDQRFLPILQHVALSNKHINHPGMGPYILADAKPEAAYFTAEGGQRGGIMVVNISDVSQIPALAEPWFLTGNAKVEFIPAMTPEDLAKAGPSIEAAVKKYA